MPAGEAQSELEAKIGERMMATAPVIVLVLACDGVIRYVNQHLERVTGFCRDELVGRNWFEVCRASEERLRLHGAADQATDATLTPGNVCGFLTRSGAVRLVEWIDVQSKGPGAESDLICLGVDVTDRDDLRYAREQERANLRAILDAIHLPIALLTPDGVVLEVNSAPTQFEVGAREDIIGRELWVTPWLDGSPEVQGRIRVAFAQAAAGGRARERVALGPSDGAKIPLEVRFAPVRDASGAIRAVVGTGASLVREMRAEETAELQSARLEEAQRIAKIGSWDLNLQTNVLYWSEEVYRIFERDPDNDSPSYESFLAAIHPEDRGIVDTAYLSSLNERRPYEITHRLQMSDGRIKWIHEHCETTFDAAGKPLVSRGTAQDVTASKMAQDTLKRSEETLASILSVSPEAIIVADSQGRIKHFSEGAEDIFRWGQGEMLGRSIDELMPERYRARHTRHLAGFAASPIGSKRMSERAQIVGLRRTGEEFAAEASVSKIASDDGFVFSVILRDVSERQAYEAALRAAKQKAETASQAKSAFLATMSHEIRTPMNGVLGLLGVLEHSELDPSQRDMIVTALDAGRGLMVILNDILDYSRLEAGAVQLEITALDLRDVLRKILSLHRLSAQEKAIDLVTDIATNIPPTLMGDATRIQQILHNVVGNAVKFTPVGRVTIEARYNQVASAGRSAHSHDVLEIEISDTGIGMSEEHMVHIFDRFSQADTSITRRYGGSGLGLAIVRGLVTAMGGEIAVESRLGQGSRFLLTLPVVAAHGADLMPSAASPASRPPEQVSRVLVVEDDPASAKVLQLLLAREGVTVTLARNGEEAIGAFEPGLFDLVLMDIQMPVLDGESAMKVLRRIESDSGAGVCFIVACTAFIHGEQGAHYRTAGFDDVIAKPLDLQRIQQTLAAAVASKRKAVH